MMNKDKGFVRLNNLYKRFGSVNAVNGVTLSISQGELLTLLGPSGSGKTTTLMMIAGFEIPDRGEIFIGGSEISKKPPYKRDLGMVFQSYALFPHMTIQENIGFPLKNRKVDAVEIRRRVGATLELLKLEGYENRYPRQLSGGQQQRVALGRALVFNPSVLLMDEPLGALDKKLREHMQMEIKRIQEALSITIIYVTHDQGEALTMSDKIAVMNDGIIEQIGSPTELYENPCNRFVADFIGESNFIKGVVIDRKASSYKVKGPKSSLFVIKSEGTLDLGSEITLAVRPEKVFFGSLAEITEGSLEGVIAEVVYVGDFTKYEVEIEGLDNYILLKKQNLKGMPHPVRGDQVRVFWNKEDVKVLLS